MLDAKQQIKVLLAMEGLGVSDLAKLKGESQPNLSKKINNNAMKYNEVLEIAKLLNYTIEWKKNI